MPADSAFTTDRSPRPGSDPAVIRYVIDSRDRIVSVNERWSTFADENAASHLRPPAVYNRPIWDFLVDRETVHLYRLIVDRVRGGETPIAFPIRCDAPHVRRFLKMHVEPADDGRVRFVSTLLRSETRPPIHLLDPAVNRTNWLLRVCSWCKKADVGIGEWVEVEEAIERLGLFESSALPQITHGMCSSCEKAMTSVIGGGTDGPTL